MFSTYRSGASIPYLTFEQTSPPPPKPTTVERDFPQFLKARGQVQCLITILDAETSK